MLGQFSLCWPGLDADHMLWQPMLAAVGHRRPVLFWVVWYFFSFVWAQNPSIQAGVLLDGCTGRAGMCRNALWPVQLQVMFDRIKMS